MKKLNPKSMPYLAALVQTFQYALAGSILIGSRGWLFGGMLGVLVSFSMALASSQISDISKKRTLAAWIAFIGLAVISPVYVGTATFYDLSIISNPIWRGVVAAVWGLIPDGSVALTGFIIGKSMVKQTTEQPIKQMTSTRSTPSKAKAKGFACPVAGCSYVATSQKALNGHQLKHRKIDVTQEYQEVKK